MVVVVVMVVVLDIMKVLRMTVQVMDRVIFNLRDTFAILF
jgi:hypothetical protein